MPWIPIGPDDQYETYVDDEDVHFLDGVYWHLRGRYVARSTGDSRTPDNPLILHYLHREIMKPDVGFVTDHIDGNTLNNSKANLRNCLQRDNTRNRAGSRVSYTPDRPRPWRARFVANGQTIHLGYFKTEAEAKAAVRKALVDVHGEFAPNDR